MLTINDLLNPLWFGTFMASANFKAIFICPDGNYIDVSGIVQPIFSINCGCLTSQTSQTELGDPCKRKRKFLIVWYTDPQGNRKTALFPEEIHVKGKKTVIKKSAYNNYCGWIWPLMY